MMRVIVHQQETVAGVFDFKSSAGVLESPQGFRNSIEGNAELGCQRDNGNCVMHVVLSRHVQYKFAELLPVAIRAEQASKIPELNVRSAVVHAFRQAEGNRAACTLGNAFCPQIVCAEKNSAG